MSANIFLSIYPNKWYWNKLIIIFKKGSRLLCGNYRGISIADTLAKLYDKVIANRLMLWMNIDKNQAGGLENRGCIEQILSIRLLIDYANVRKKPCSYVLLISPGRMIPFLARYYLKFCEKPDVVMSC